MRLLYSFIGWGIVVLGTIHMLATLHFFRTLTSAALWFFSGGIAMALAGALNLLHRAYGQVAPGLRKVCIGANLMMLAFGIVSGLVSRASIAQLALVIGLTGGATVLSMSSGVLKRPGSVTDSA